MKDFTPYDARQLIGRDDAVILEIGANEADDTVHFLRAFPEGTIYCFECDPRAIAKFSRKCTDPRATLYEVALADTCGKRTFHQSGGKPPGKSWRDYEGEWDKSGSLLPVDKHCEHSPWLKFKSTIEVECWTLDYWAEGVPYMGEFSLLWADVQGAEHLVFRGGKDVLKRTRYVYAECDPRHNYKDNATLSDLDAELSQFDRIGEYGGYNFLWKNRNIM